MIQHLLTTCNSQESGNEMRVSLQLLYNQMNGKVEKKKATTVFPFISIFSREGLLCKKKYLNVEVWKHSHDILYNAPCTHVNFFSSSSLQKKNLSLHTRSCFVRKYGWLFFLFANNYTSGMFNVPSWKNACDSCSPCNIIIFLPESYNKKLQSAVHLFGMFTCSDKKKPSCTTCVRNFWQTEEKKYPFFLFFPIFSVFLHNSYEKFVVAYVYRFPEEREQGCCWYPLYWQSWCWFYLGKK